MRLHESERAPPSLQITVLTKRSMHVLSALQLLHHAGGPAAHCGRWVPPRCRLESRPMNGIDPPSPINTAG